MEFSIVGIDYPSTIQFNEIQFKIGHNQDGVVIAANWAKTSIVCGQ